MRARLGPSQREFCTRVGARHRHCRCEFCSTFKGCCTNNLFPLARGPAGLSQCSRDSRRECAPAPRWHHRNPVASQERATRSHLIPRVAKTRLLWPQSSQSAASAVSSSSSSRIVSTYPISVASAPSSAARASAASSSSGACAAKEERRPSQCCTRPHGGACAHAGRCTRRWRRVFSELSRSCLGKVSEGSRKGLGAASWLSRIQRLGPRYPRYRLVLPCHLHLRQERWG